MGRRRYLLERLSSTSIIQCHSVPTAKSMSRMHHATAWLLIREVQYLWVLVEISKGDKISIL